MSPWILADILFWHYATIDLHWHFILSLKHCFYRFPLHYFVLTSKCHLHGLGMTLSRELYEEVWSPWTRWIKCITSNKLENVLDTHKFTWNNINLLNCFRKVPKVSHNMDSVKVLIFHLSDNTKPYSSFLHQCFQRRNPVPFCGTLYPFVARIKFFVFVFLINMVCMWVCACVCVCCKQLKCKKYVWSEQS